MILKFNNYERLMEKFEDEILVNNIINVFLDEKPTEMIVDDFHRLIIFKRDQKYFFVLNYYDDIIAERNNNIVTVFKSQYRLNGYVSDLIDKIINFSKIKNLKLRIE